MMNSVHHLSEPKIAMANHSEQRKCPQISAVLLTYSKCCLTHLFYRTFRKRKKKNINFVLYFPYFHNILFAIRSYHLTRIFVYETSLGKAYLIRSWFSWMLSPALIASVKQVRLRNLLQIKRTMNSVTVFLVMILWCSCTMGSTIISMDTFYDENTIDSTENDMSIDNLMSANGETNILESVYAMQSIGKSHRFYFTQGERKEGKRVHMLNRFSIA